MGGKTSTSTSSTTIPQSVLDRYNSVNQTAENVAQTPFQQYSSNASDFVSQLTPTQQAGIDQTNSYANEAAPYLNTAQYSLSNAQNQGQQYYNNASNELNTGETAGYNGTNAATQTLGGVASAANPYNQQASDFINQAANQSPAYLNTATGLAAAGAQAVNPGALDTLSLIHI